MPHHKQFEKTLKKDAKRRLVNRPRRARLRHAVSDLRDTKSVEEATAKLPKVFALLDKGAKKHLIHASTANRLKSRLANYLNRLRASA